MGLDEIALKEIAGLRFKPAMLNGQPVAVGATMELTLKTYADLRPGQKSAPISEEDVRLATPPAFSDWLQKPATAVLGPIPACCGTL